MRPRPRKPGSALASRSPEIDHRSSRQSSFDDSFDHASPDGSQHYRVRRFALLLLSPFLFPFRRSPAVLVSLSLSCGASDRWIDRARGPFSSLASSLARNPCSHTLPVADRKPETGYGTLARAALGWLAFRYRSRVRASRVVWRESCCFEFSDEHGVAGSRSRSGAEGRTRQTPGDGGRRVGEETRAREREGDREREREERERETERERERERRRMETCGHSRLRGASRRNATRPAERSSCD